MFIYSNPSPTHDIVPNRVLSNPPMSGQLGFAKNQGLSLLAYGAQGCRMTSKSPQSRRRPITSPFPAAIVIARLKGVKLRLFKDIVIQMGKARSYMASAPLGA